MLKIDMNRFKSIWGHEGPGYDHNELVMFKAHEDKKYGALWRRSNMKAFGPRADWGP